MDYLSRLVEKPTDPILGLSALFVTDASPHKLNLTIGAYKTEQGQVALLQSVHEAERIILDEKRNKAYPPIDGTKSFRDNVIKLLFKDSDPATFYSAHTTGCTAALRVSGELLREMGITTIFLPDQTWQNHYLVYGQAGLKTESYSYYDNGENRIKLTEMLETLNRAPINSALLFQVSCHNPIGRDPTREQWKQLIDKAKERNVFLVLDCSYHGFGEGLEEDLYPVRLAQSSNTPFFLAYSFGKNFGLYGERVGAFIAYDPTKKRIERIESNVKHVIRGSYSCPPIHGARIVDAILGTKELRDLWELELFEMRKRLRLLRRHFIEALKEAGIQKNYHYIEQDCGLFSLMGLSKEQVVKLREKRSIYILENGRINIAALSSKNMNIVAEGIKDVL